MQEQKSPQHMSVQIYKLPREVEDKMRLEPFKRKPKKLLTSPYMSEEFFGTDSELVSKRRPRRDALLVGSHQVTSKQYLLRTE